jgi:hypothetical protein
MMAAKMFERSGLLKNNNFTAFALYFGPIRYQSAHFASKLKAKHKVGVELFQDCKMLTSLLFIERMDSSELCCANGTCS